MRTILSLAFAVSLAAPSLAAGPQEDMATAALGPSPELISSYDLASCVVNVRSNDTLNVRTGPSTKHRIRFAMPPYACGIYVNYRKCSGSWCKISYNGRSGWAHTRYLN